MEVETLAREAEIMKKKLARVLGRLTVGAALMLFTLAGWSCEKAGEPTCRGGDPGNGSAPAGGFPARPAAVDPRRWSKLEAAVMASAQFEAKLLPEPPGVGGPNANFGTVSLSGNRALVGARNLGVAFVYRETDNGWEQEAVLRPDQKPVERTFGSSVSLDGDRALVGAEFENGVVPGSGAAFVFAFDGAAWTQEARLVPDSGAFGDRFGYSVSLDGGRALVGAYGVDSFTGTVHVFARNGSDWSLEDTLTAADAQIQSRFGFSVSLDGDRALVGNLIDASLGSPQLPGSAYVFERNGDSWSQQAALTASDGTLQNFFGLSVSLDGDRAVVGATAADSTIGAAYVFAFDGVDWAEELKLVASDGAVYDRFGENVLIRGDTIVVASRQSTFPTEKLGVTYVYRLDEGTWAEEAVLTASDGAPGNFFGRGLGLDNDRLLIGAPGDDEAGPDVGAVYYLTRENATWDEVEKINGEFGSAGRFAGIAVSLHGDRALVGGNASAVVYAWSNDQWLEEGELADAGGVEFNSSVSVSLDNDRALVGDALDSEAGPLAGAAFLFHHDGVAWNLEQKLQADELASDGQGFEYFGWSVSLDGDRALIGAFRDEANGVRAGAAYVFHRELGSWSQEARLSDPAGVLLDLFGTSVSLDGDRALVGAPQSSFGGESDGSGLAHFFVRGETGWEFEQTVTASDEAAEDQFGWSVSLDGSRALVGAYLADAGDTDAGAAYVFRNSEGGWTEEQKLVAANPSSGAEMGISVSLQGDLALVGSREIGGLVTPGQQTGPGSARLFSWQDGQWRLDTRIAAEDGEVGERFGSSVSLGGKRILLGAPGDDDRGQISGSAYLYRLDLGEVVLDDDFEP